MPPPELPPIVLLVTVSVADPTSITPGKDPPKLRFPLTVLSEIVSEPWMSHIAAACASALSPTVLFIIVVVSQISSPPFAALVLTTLLVSVRGLKLSMPPPLKLTVLLVRLNEEPELKIPQPGTFRMVTPETLTVLDELVESWPPS